MSYQIIYTEDTSTLTRPSKRWKIISIILLTAAVVGVALSDSRILYHAFPIFREEVRQAFSAMLENIKDGVPVGEAAVAFGQQIIFT